MKRMIVVIVIIVIMGVLTTAATPATTNNQSLVGRLMWQRASVCVGSDSVATDAMTNVYLTGKFAPTHGLFVGCRVAATGSYFRSGSCEYFSVATYKITCPSSVPPVVDH